MSDRPPPPVWLKRTQRAIPVLLGIAILLPFIIYLVGKYI